MHIIGLQIYELCRPTPIFPFDWAHGRLLEPSKSHSVAEMEAEGARNDNIQMITVGGFTWHARREKLRKKRKNYARSEIIQGEEKFGQLTYMSTCTECP